MIVTEEFLRKHNLKIDSAITFAPTNVTIRRNEMKNKTGGSAFPSTITDDSLHVQGMTLRDYFAAKAMPEILAYQINSVVTRSIEDVAKMAYEMADAMLKAKGETDE